MIHAYTAKRGTGEGNASVAAKPLKGVIATETLCAELHVTPHNVSSSMPKIEDQK